MFETKEQVKILRQCPACSASILSPVAPHWFQKSGNKSALTSPYKPMRIKLISEDKEWELIREHVVCAQCGCFYERTFEIRPHIEIKKVKPIGDDNESK